MSDPKIKKDYEDEIEDAVYDDDEYDCTNQEVSKDDYDD